MAEMDPFSTFFDNFSKSSKSKVIVEANEQVFTPEILAEIATNNLELHRLIEMKITKLVRMITTESISEESVLPEMISTLRNVSLTYLPKV
jgi:hypothetical protein